ncbi:MAG: 2,3-bisphosphoglycerate-independent phosphoglycerate mutase [Halothermotrichaceae bacterium]
MARPKPLALIILDGFGIRDNKEGNAVEAADTPNIDKIMKKYPKTTLGASGKDVGLPEGQMGNSEVGHLNLGAGRIVYQDYTRINKAIDDDSILENGRLKKAIKHVKKHDSALHLMGLLSDGGVHSHIRHLFGLLEMADDYNLDKVYVHAFMDGRDTPPKSGAEYMQQLEDKIDELGTGQIATVSGRYYAMDRDNRWDRTQKAYNAMVLGRGNKSNDAVTAVEDSYNDEVTDEFIVPVVIEEDGEPVATVADDDAVVFFNFRADRARQITRALAIEDFEALERPEKHPEDLYYVCMTEYDEEFGLPIAFPPAEIKNGFAETLSKNDIRQLRIAETEKYAHVTFFFNGGIEKKYPGEDRELIPSPKVATYDLKPEMSAYEVTDALIEKINEDKYDVVILNYANCDMVGHTGIFEAAVQAVETVDECLGKLLPVILDKGGQVLLTADHGNSEKMFEADGEPFTAHTTSLVPLVYIGGSEGVGVKSGKLADIAPTMLNLLGLDIPEEMTGDILIDD